MSEPKIGQKVMVEGQECTVVSVNEEDQSVLVKAPSGKQMSVAPDQIGQVEESEGEDEGEDEGKGTGEGEGKDSGEDDGPGSGDEGQDKVTGPEADEVGATGATGEDEGPSED